MLSGWWKRADWVVEEGRWVVGEGGGKRLLGWWIKVDWVVDKS